MLRRDRGRSGKSRQHHRTRLYFEGLGTRLLPSFGTGFGGGVLVITGDGANDVGSVTRNAAGDILLGGVAIVGSPTVTNTTSISFTGGAGNDTLSIDLPGYGGTITLDGGAGNDILTGGTTAESILGGDNNDTLNRRGQATTRSMAVPATTA